MFKWKLDNTQGSIKNEQSRESGNIGYPRPQDEEKTETGSIGYTRRR